MQKLTEEYGIEVDSRFATCDREALISVTLFVVAASVAIATMYGLTAGRRPDSYGTVLGLPSYLFWGIVVVDLGLLVALALSLKFGFRELPLDAIDPASRDDQSPAR